MHERFGSLDFFVTTEGVPVWAPAPTQLLCSTSLDATVKALKEMQLHALEAYAPRCD